MMHGLEDNSRELEAPPVYQAILESIPPACLATSDGRIQRVNRALRGCFRRIRWSAAAMLAICFSRHAAELPLSDEARAPHRTGRQPGGSRASGQVLPPGADSFGACRRTSRTRPDMWW